MSPDELLAMAYARDSGDIREHLPKLRALAAACSTVVEFGVYRGASSAALLAGTPGSLYSYDTMKQPEVDTLLDAADGRWIFRLCDSHKAAIPECDLLFIDSWHTAEHLRGELETHHAKVKRWIVMHDTETFAHKGEDGGPGLWGAMMDFLERHPEWRLSEHFTNCNGLSILERA